MMRWYQELYIGESLKSDASVIQAEVRAWNPSPEIYLLCLAANGIDLMDIVPTIALRQQGARTRQWDIVGLARSKEEATSLAAAVMEDVWKKTGGFDLRGFVEGRMIAD